MRLAKASPFGRGVCAADGEGKPGTKEHLHSDKHWLLIESSYRCVFVLSQRPCPLSRACARQGRVAAPSVCFAAARILLAAAPTAPPCFRHWRRSSPLPPKGEPLAGRATFRWTLKARRGAKGRALLQRAAASGQRSLLSCRWPRQRSTTVSETSCFARPA